MKWKNYSLFAFWTDKVIYYSLVHKQLTKQAHKEAGYSWPKVAYAQSHSIGCPFLQTSVLLIGYRMVCIVANNTLHH